MCSGLSGEEACSVVSVYQNVGQLVLNYKVEKLLCRLGMRPAVLVAVSDGQPSLLCRLLEAFVVVGIAATAVLYAARVIVVVNHLVQERRADVFYGSGECACTDVDFVTAANSRYPRIIIECEMTVCTRCALRFLEERFPLFELFDLGDKFIS